MASSSKEQQHLRACGVANGKIIQEHIRECGFAFDKLGQQRHNITCRIHREQKFAQHIPQANRWFKGGTTA